MEVNNLYKTSGKNSDFPYLGLPYAEYISQMREVISQTRLDLDQDNRDIIIEANSPAEFIPQQKPIKNGILLVHGLLDSPLSMQSLFDYFKQENFLVRSLLLPGHGTLPGDLLDVKLDSWLKAINYAVDCCLQEVDNLYIVGLSTGASLGLYQSYLDDRIKGLIMLAPAIEIKNSFAAISQWHKAFAIFGERAKWVNILEEDDYAKYHSITLNSIAQLYHLIKKNKKLYKRKKPSIPIFMVLSDDDETIDSHAAERFFKKYCNQSSRLVIYSNDRTTSDDRRIVFRPSSYPEQMILNFSHTCLGIAPDHRHYGMDGDYIDRQHYKQWWGKSFRKNSHLAENFGAITKYNLSNYNLSRVTYNFDFMNMMKRVDNFIREIGGKS